MSDPDGGREAEIEAVAKALVRAAAPHGILAPRRSAEAAIAALDAVRSSGSAAQNHNAYVEPLDGGWRGFQARCWDCDWTGPEHLRGDEQMGTDESRAHKNAARAEASEHRRASGSAAQNQETLDAAYAERNAVVLAFARLAVMMGWQVGVLHDAAEPDWPVLMIDTHRGQVSWHFKADELPEGEFDPYPGEWDGHTTPEKYERLSLIGLSGSATRNQEADPTGDELLCQKRQAVPRSVAAAIEREFGSSAPSLDERV